MLLVYLGILIVLIYTITLCVKNKTIPPSVSETWYMGGKHWFTITMFIASFLVIAGLLNLTEGSNWQFISFLTGIGMAFVGAAPEFHEEFAGKVHMGGAIALLAGSQLWVTLFSTPWCLLCWLPAIWWLTTPQKVFWCEMTAIASVALSLLFV